MSSNNGGCFDNFTRQQHDPYRSSRGQNTFEYLSQQNSTRLNNPIFLFAVIIFEIILHNHAISTIIRAHVFLCLYISIFGTQHLEAFSSRLRHDVSSLTSHHFTTCTSDAALGPQPASSHHHRTYAEIAGGSEERSSHDRQNINSLPGSAPCQTASAGPIGYTSTSGPSQPSYRASRSQKHPATEVANH